ncbi:MAG: alpha/beta hydrolase family protein [Sphingomonadaceae bacterium]
MRPHSSLSLSLSTVLCSLLLAACGGGGGSGGSGNGSVIVVPPPPPVSLRGKLIGNASVVPVSAGTGSVTTLDPATFKQLLEAAQKGSSAITGTPTCAVTTYTVRYHTVGAAVEDTEASSAIMVPSGADSNCSGARPVLLYAHGTSVQKSTDMANLSGTEARLVAAMYAAQGYIVVAPNYAGYAGSTLAYHSYLDATQQSDDMVDALRAARLSFASIGASDSGRLLLAGYSQGGYVALATQRAMQTKYASEFNVTAAAPMSGPYALLQFGDAIFGGAPTQGSSAFLPMLINAAQRAGAALYTSPGDVYEAKYANGIETLLPGTSSLGELVAAGKLPNDVLFAQDSLPQAAGYSSFFGADHLVKSSYRQSYLADLQAAPCNTSHASPLACTPAQPLRRWLLKNDLRTYVPAVPLLLCGGDQDPLVPFLNAESAAAYFNAQGKAAGTLTLLNLDGALGFDAYTGIRQQFVTARQALRLATIVAGGDGDKAVRDAYHAGLVAPFCMRATRDFFQSAPIR